MPEYNEQKVFISNIQRFSVNDGPGIRTTVFLKGCNLRCHWCHNPETIETKKVLQFTKSACTGCCGCVAVCPNASQQGSGQIDRALCTACGLCAEVCPNLALSVVGKHMSAEELLDIIRRDRPYYEESGGGVTFSGGEPMLQTGFLARFLPMLKKEGYHIAVDTAGNVPFDAIKRILPYTNLFLYDIKAVSTDIHKRFTGVTNEAILKNLRLLNSAGARIWVRIPVVAGVNDSMDEISKIAEFLSPLSSVEQIELLSYHNYGVGKYASLGLEYKLTGPGTPSDAFMAEANDLISGIKSQ